MIKEEIAKNLSAAANVFHFQDCAKFMYYCDYDEDSEKAKKCCEGLKCHVNRPIDSRAWCIHDSDTESEDD